VNYRHHYHAGNFADVMKHAVLVQLVRGLQRKDKGFLYLDTHAGRGGYDLAAARHGDTLERKPEHPDGIGRLAAGAAAITSEPLADYLRLVREFDRRSGNPGPGAIRFYPGSPSLVRALLRPQDRMALCELPPVELQSLRNDVTLKTHPAASASFSASANANADAPASISLHEMDGYTALRAMLPAPEKRALVLIDPPYEARDEYEKIAQALRDALRRMGAATYAVWYPLTERARSAEFLDKLAMLNPPPTLAAELAVAGENSALKMRGCGLAVINPPWQIDQILKPMLAALAPLLAQAPGAGASLEWIVRE
jgi:23S rRNA (adenine2030-N6)-methyltransferase